MLCTTCTYISFSYYISTYIVCIIFLHKENYVSVTFFVIYLAGHLKAFGEQADKSLFKIEDRVVVHPGDPQASTCSIRDTEYRVVSDLKYLLPCSSKIPMKLAAILGGRGLSIYSAALTILDHVRSILNNNKERYKIHFFVKMISQFFFICSGS